MSTALSVLGVWLLVSVPFGMFIGLFCGLNDLDSEELPISEEVLTSGPVAKPAGFGAVRPA